MTPGASSTAISPSTHVKMFSLSFCNLHLDAPTIRLLGAPQIDLEEGKDVLILRCEADANLPASIVWRRSGRSEIASLQVSYSMRLDRVMMRYLLGELLSTEWSAERWSRNLFDHLRLVASILLHILILEVLKLSTQTYQKPKKHTDRWPASSTCITTFFRHGGVQTKL